MFHIRFPYEFDYYHSQKYGGKRSYYGGAPATISISYATAVDDTQATAQKFHKEMMDAQHKWNVNRIKSVADYQHKYPAYPGKRQGATKISKSIAGFRPLQTSQEGTPLHTKGSLATFPGLIGGVLKDYKYARKILDRRRDQVLATQDPAFQPSAPTLTPEDQAKLDLNALFREVIDAFITGTVTDVTYGAMRRLVASLINTIPFIEDEDDLRNIYQTIVNTAEEARALAEPGEMRRGVQVAREQLRDNQARHNRALAVMERIGEFLRKYMDYIEKGTRSLKDRQTASKSFAKSSGLLGFADFKAIQQGVAEAEPEEEEGAPGPGPGGDGGPPPSEPSTRGEEEEEEEEEASVPSGRPSERPASGGEEEEEEESEETAETGESDESEGFRLPYDPDLNWTIPKRDARGYKIGTERTGLPITKTQLYAFTETRLMELANSVNTNTGSRPKYAQWGKQKLRNYVANRLATGFKHPLIGYEPYTRDIEHYRAYHD